MISRFKLENMSTGTEALFGQDPSYAFLFKDGGIDWGKVSATHNSYTYPGQIGSYISSTTLKERDISIVGYICYTPTNEDRKSYSSVNDLKEYVYQKIVQKKILLNSIINPMDTIRMTIGDYHIDGKPSSSIVYGKTESDNNRYFCKFTFSLFCNDPTFRKTSAVQTILSGSVPGFRFPLVFPKNKGVIFSEQRSYSLIAIDNSGQVSIGCQISLYSHGSVVNPRIENILTGESIKIDKTMVNGERIVINTNDGTEKGVTGYLNGEELNYFKYWNFENSWMKFPVGTSLVGYSVDNGQESLLDVSIVIVPKKLSLEEM